MAIIPVPGACTNCGGGGGGAGADAIDVENLILCDVLADGSIAGTALAVYEYDVDGNPVGVPTFVDPTTGAPYVPTGTLQPCGGETHIATEILCDIQPDNSAVTFKRIEVLGPANTVVDTIDVTLDGAPYAPTGVVGDCTPYRLCTPDATQDLNGDCGPGEPVNSPIIEAEGVAPDSVIADDPTADALCGGSWPRAGEPSAFTVNETFRNATFDQPGPVIQGTAPYAGLTANPAFTGSNAGDPAGQGWLQTSDQNSATNGIWQVPNPFPAAAGLTASVTFASSDGAGGQNGDGMAFVFTDGGVPPETGAIGGGGGLGIPNWDGGYIAVVLDEYGGAGNAFQANSIKLIPAGPPGTAFNNNTVIASMSLAPKAINLNNTITRANPGRLIVSIINDGPDTLLSASVLWDGDTEPTVYFNRFSLTGAGMPQAPATMRMSLYGGSGGAFRSEHEFRDALATSAGLQEWRAFPIVTDPIPACVTSVTVQVCVDQTFTDTTATVGDGLPEAFLWLVNTATNTVLDKAQRSSIPSQVGVSANLCVDTVVPVAQLPNLRFYVGSETRDALGTYGALWENLEVTVGGLGCPVVAQRTIAISAPCPIPVTIVGGSSDGTPAPVTVVNTPSTFEDAPVCINVGGVFTTGFRREVRNADGSVTITFIGATGGTVTPDSWDPGQCPEGSAETVELCDFDVANIGPTGGIATRRLNRTYYRDSAGALVNTADTDQQTGAPYVPFAGGFIGTCGRLDSEQQFFCNLDDIDPLTGKATVFWRDYQFDTQSGTFVTQNAHRLDDNTLYAVGIGDEVVPWPCGDTSTEVPCGQVIGEECYAGGVVSVVRDCETGAVVYYDRQTGVVVAAPVFTVCEQTFLNQEVLCDDNGPFLRGYFNFGGTVNIADTTLDGVTPYVTVGTVVVCGGEQNDIEIEPLCDYQFTAAPGGAAQGTILNKVPFLRRYIYDGLGALVNFADFATDGTTPYAPSGAIQAPCDGFSSESDVQILCDLPTGVPFLRRYVNIDGVYQGTVDSTLNGTTPYLVVGTAGSCAAAAYDSRDAESFVMCSSTPVAGTQFIRTYLRDGETGAFVSVSDTTLTGAPFVPGVVSICTQAIQSDTDFVQEVLCDTVGSFIRRFTFNSVTGAVIAVTNLTLAGAAYVPVGAVGTCDVCCPIVIGEGCTNVGSLRYTALRLANGTISLIDSVSGATILPAAIVACASDDTARTLNAQARLVGDADAPWTPGADVVGVLTSVTMTVISGTATLTDQSGTVLAGLPAGFSATWNAEDDNTLLGPTSIDAIGGSTVVHWTQR